MKKLLMLSALLLSGCIHRPAVKYAIEKELVDLRAEIARIDQQSQVSDMKTRWDMSQLVHQDFRTHLRDTGCKCKGMHGPCAPKCHK